MSGSHFFCDCCSPHMFSGFPVYRFLICQTSAAVLYFLDNFHSQRQTVRWIWLQVAYLWGEENTGRGLGVKQGGDNQKQLACHTSSCCRAARHRPTGNALWSVGTTHFRACLGEGQRSGTTHTPLFFWGLQMKQVSIRPACAEEAASDLGCAQAVHW